MVWYSFPQSSSPILQKLYNTKMHSDVQLSAGESGRKIFAHKVVLSLASDYFKLMFSGSFKESIDSTVTVHDIESDTLKAVIQFIYCGSVEISNHDVAIKLLKSAHLMELPQLMTYSEDFLVANMTDDICWEMYLLAKLYNIDNLSNVAKDLIAKDFLSITQKDDFRQLDEASLLVLISEIHKLIVPDDIVKGILTWAEDNKREFTHFKDFLQLIEIESISDDLIDLLFKFSSGKEECGMIINALKKRPHPCHCQSTKLIVLVKKDKSKYSIFKYNFANKILSKEEGSDIPNHGNVIGVWNEIILFEKKDELIIYDVQTKSISSSTYYAYYDNLYLKSCPRIGDNVFFLSKKILYKLNLLAFSFERIVPIAQLNCYTFDAMCEVNGELKIVAHNNYNYGIEILSYHPLLELWNIEPGDTNLTHSTSKYHGILKAHKNCLYYFQNEYLHSFNIGGTIWNSVKIQPENQVENIKNVVFIDDKMIICTEKKIYEYMTDQQQLKDDSSSQCCWREGFAVDVGKRDVSIANEKLTRGILFKLIE